MNVSFTPDTTKRIAVICTDHRGFGDYSCGLKIIAIFHDCLRLPRENCVLFVSKASTASQLNHRNFNIQQIPQPKADIFDSHYEDSIKKANDEFEKQLSDFHPDAIIVSPVMIDTSYLQKLNVPIIYISEYASPPPGEQLGYSFGLSTNSLGIHIDSALERWSKTVETATERLSHLSQVPHRIQKAILGDTTITTFSQSSLFYFGYINNEHLSSVIQDQQSFICAMAKMNSTKNLCFFFMGRLTSIYTKEFGEQLQQFGITRIELVDLRSVCLDDDQYPSETQVQTIDLVPTPTPRTARIIFGYIARAFVNPLIQASEKQVVATGDQFLSEVISARKQLVYHTVTHKVSLLLSLRNMISEHGKEIAALFKDCNLPHYYRFSIEGVTRFFTVMQQNQEIAAQWDNAMNTICSTHNSEPLLVNKMRQIFAFEEACPQVFTRPLRKLILQYC